MKNIALLLFGLICFSVSYSQNLPNFSSIKLETKQDYDSSANKAAWQAADYLLSTPLDKSNPDRQSSVTYMMRWMTGSPEFNFNIDEEATNISKQNNDLLGIYLAAMTKYMLENKQDSKDANKVKLNTVKIVIQYAKDPKNKIKPSGELKKVTEADEKGKLTEYLKM